MVSNAALGIVIGSDSLRAVARSYLRFSITRNGGILLILPGILIGGTLPAVTLTGIIYLILLIAISALGFTLYNKLLSCNPVGKVAIFNSLIPAVGAITSCICLNEPFYWKYVMATILATTGIYIINKGKR